MLVMMVVVVVVMGALCRVTFFHYVDFHGRNATTVHGANIQGCAEFQRGQCFV